MKIDQNLAVAFYFDNFSRFWWLCSAGSDEDIVVVLEDYPSAEISEPIYRKGEMLQVIAQYDAVCLVFVQKFER